MIPAQSRSESQNIIPLLQHFGIGVHLPDHDFRNAGERQDVVEFR